MIKKLIVAITVIVVASLPVSGCITTTPSSTESASPATQAKATSTPKPVSDYSSYYNDLWEGSATVVERPFTKSINYRGNDVYTGVIRRTDRSLQAGVTCVIEFTKTKDAAKKLFDDAVAKKQGEGYTYRSDWVAEMKSDESAVQYDDVWSGSSGYEQSSVFYRYDPYVSSWVVMIQTG